MPAAFAIAAAKTDSWGISVGVITEVPGSSPGRVGGFRLAGKVLLWGSVVLESNTRSQLLIAAEITAPLVGQFWGVFCDHSWEFRLDLFLKLFQWSKFTHPVLNPLLLISQPATEPAQDNRLPQWDGKVGFAGVAVGDRDGEVKSGPVVRNLAYQVKRRRPHSVSNG